MELAHGPRGSGNGRLLPILLQGTVFHLPLRFPQATLSWQPWVLGIGIRGVTSCRRHDSPRPLLCHGRGEGGRGRTRLLRRSPRWLLLLLPVPQRMAAEEEEEDSPALQLEAKSGPAPPPPRPPSWSSPTPTLTTKGPSSSPFPSPLLLLLLSRTGRSTIIHSPSSCRFRLSFLPPFLPGQRGRAQCPTGTISSSSSRAPPLLPRSLRQRRATRPWRCTRCDTRS